jgi:hypothetical protein
VCTVICLWRPGHAWPVLVAANRDERLDRAWQGPAAHWPDRPGVVGGRDLTAGGTWMALGPGGVLAAILNRPGSLGPAAGKRSRGDLPLAAAAAPSAEAAVAAMAALDAGAWRPFNMVIADHAGAWFVKGLGEGRPRVMPLAPGISMVTAHDPNDLGSPRTARHLPLFQAAPPPDPDRDDWSGWAALLADDTTRPGMGAEALRVPPVGGFGTVCASLVALAADGRRRWRFCPAPPGTAPFAPVALSPPLAAP